MRVYRYVLIFVLLFAVTTSSKTQEHPLLGFTSQSSKKQAEMEKKIIGFPSTERMDEYHKNMTAKPHNAGTKANEEAAEYYAARLREFGFDEVIMNLYEALLPRPEHREITLIEPETYSLKLMEPPFPEDPSSGMENVLPPFNAYSKDGDVTAEVVYVNYGIPADYDVLDSLGVSVAGKIVLARYGRSWRGIKPRLAAEHGAVACLIYSDPAEDGFVKGDVIPQDKWRPEYGVQRGSVMDMPTYPGDPQTPMEPSKKGVKRLPLNEITTLQKIPVHPISYGDALPILRNLAGDVVPEKWRGGLPTTYHFGPGPAKIHLNLTYDWSVRPIVNVIGIIKGSEEPEKIVMAGGHRDAWTFGGQDPISGAASMLETARIIAELAKQGYRPKRSIAIASWDAEEYGLIGSTEYGEEFGAKLQGNMVVYLNRESYAAGHFGAGGVHSLQPFINQITKAVNLPDSQVTIFDSWFKNANEKNIIEQNNKKQVRIGALGSGSDYTVFLDHLGIPAADFGFSSGNGIYHSRYDSRWFFTTFGDPGFRYGKTIAELVAVFLLRMAQADILPFDYQTTAKTINGYLDELEIELNNRNLSDQVDLSAIRSVNKQLSATAIVLNGEIQRILSLNPARLNKYHKQIRKLNDLLLGTEMAFLSKEGLPGRPWFRHQVYAPGFYTGYGVKTLPGVREAIEKQDVEEIKKMSVVLEEALNRARKSLLQAIGVAINIKE